MRHTIFLLIALILFLEAESQDAHPMPGSPTAIDKFIWSPMVDWAYYTIDTLRTVHYDLVNVLLDRISKNQIKTAIVPENNRANKFAWFNNSQLKKHSIISDTLMVYDSELSQYKQIIGEREVACDTGVISTAEIYYVSEGKLKTYVPWINIVAPVYTSYGEYLGRGNQFSTCINTDYRFINKGTDKLYFIASVVKTLKADSLKKEDKLKEMYGRNLAETLWPFVLDGRNKMIALSPKVGSLIKSIQYADSRPLSIEEIKNLAYGSNVYVPIYDSLGNILGNRYVSLPLLPSDFNSVEIIENWFYDFTANKMICKIPEIVFLINSERVLKIVF